MSAFLQTLLLSVLRSSMVERVTDKTERLGLIALLVAASLVLATATMVVLLIAFWIWLTRHMAPDYAALVIAGILLTATLAVAFWVRHLLRPPAKRPAPQAGSLTIPEWAMELFNQVKPHLSEAVIASLIAGWAAGRRHKE